MEQLKRNQRISLTIDDISHQGSGVGRYNGQVVFVPATAVGDTVQAKIVHTRKNLAYGIVEELQTPSPDRVENDCPSYPACGGCSLRHLRYRVECEYKEQIVKDNLQRIGNLTPALHPLLPSPVVDRYRNKVQLPIEKVGDTTRFGFYAPRSHDVIPMEDCLLQPELFSLLARELCRFMDDYNISAYDETTHSGLVRHLYLRQAGESGRIMAVVVINGEELPHWRELLDRWMGQTAHLSTVLINHNSRNTNVVLGKRNTILYGEGILVDRLLGIELELSPDSFYQINYAATQHLYRQAISYAAPRPSDILLDLYCGVGSIGLTMASMVKELIGVEIVPEAVENASRNAKRNKIENARFICADATQAAVQLAKEGLSPTIVVVDPPRKGVDQQALEAIVAMAPEKLVYISCNSATLARDCKYLAEQGYHIRKGRGVDLFPRTPHVESVMLLER